jgi:molecular chaperone GrpE
MRDGEGEGGSQQDAPGAGAAAAEAAAEAPQPGADTSAGGEAVPDVVFDAGGHEDPLEVDVIVDEPSNDLLFRRIAELEGALAMATSAREASEARLRDVESKARAISKAYQEQRDDMVSFRTRMEAQAAQRADRKQAEVCERFFEPVQNLRRALKAPSDDLAAFRTGVQMVLHQFDDSLRGLGLEEVPGEGTDFDPTIHEALAIVPVTDAAKDGKVVSVFNTGYRLGARVLQPAQVVIGKFDPPAEA